MGAQIEAKCLDCGKVFTLDLGGGFFFHLLRCDKCGRTKSIGFDELGELHLRYVKGLPGPYCIASAEHDKHVQKYTPVEPISEEDYHTGIEVIAGKCGCGGKYTFAAPPRCPKCLSTRIEEGAPLIMYD